MRFFFALFLTNLRASFALRAAFWMSVQGPDGHR